MHNWSYLQNYKLFKFIIPLVAINVNDYVMWHVIVQSWRLTSFSLSPSFLLLRLHIKRQVEHTKTTTIKKSSVTIGTLHQIHRLCQCMENVLPNLQNERFLVRWLNWHNDHYKTSAFKLGILGVSLNCLYCDNNYICSSACQWCLSTVSLYSSTSTINV